MYYIVKHKNRKDYSLVQVKEADDGTYREIKELTDDIKGQFGRLDYAEIWCDFHNDKITRDQLRIRLNI